MDDQNDTAVMNQMIFGRLKQMLERRQNDSATDARVAREILRSPDIL